MRELGAVEGEETGARPTRSGPAERPTMLTCDQLEEREGVASMIRPLLDWEQRLTCSEATGRRTSASSGRHLALLGAAAEAGVRRTKLAEDLG